VRNLNGELTNLQRAGLRRLRRAGRHVGALVWIGRNAPLVRQELELQAQVSAVSQWLEYLPPQPPYELVSIVMPTRNRASLLQEAISSVQSQTWDSWQLVIVNDGSTDQTGELLADISDSRITVVETSGVGSASARNAGLRVSEGRYITYLDDDNLMGRQWLAAVVWAFRMHQNATVLYGARVVEDDHLVPSARRSPLPQMILEPYDRKRILVANYIDLGTIAHRSDCAGATFDDALGPSDDYDFILRLTAERPPLAIPVVASLYRTSAQHRLSDRPEASDENLAVSAQHRKRVLGC